MKPLICGQRGFPPDKEFTAYQIGKLGFQNRMHVTPSLRVKNVCTALNCMLPSYFTHCRRTVKPNTLHLKVNKLEFLRNRDLNVIANEEGPNRHK